MLKDKLKVLGTATKERYLAVVDGARAAAHYETIGKKGWRSKVAYYSAGTMSTAITLWQMLMEVTICKLFGCKLEMEAHITPDSGSEHWHCTRCNTGGSHTYY